MRFAITGTDTGVGKTAIACALVAALAQRGISVAAMKPVETGTEPDDVSSDAHRLRAAAGDRHPLALVRPFVFPSPVAPLAAARLAAGAFDPAIARAAYRALTEQSDFTIVEGAGGLLVPFANGLTFADVAREWGLSLVIVAANRLGCVNHALLTVDAARARALPIIAVVLNEISLAPVDASAGGNADLIAEFVSPIPVLRFPWVPQTGDHHALARAAETSGLVDTLITTRAS